MKQENEVQHLGSEIEILKIMSDEYARARMKNPQYSLRAFARKLGLFPSAVSEIMNGKRRITRHMGTQILMRLGRDLEQTQEMCGDLKGKYRNEEGNFEELPTDVLTHFLDWHHSAILSLADTKDFKGDVDWIAERINGQKRAIAAALDRLERLQLLARDEKGELKPTGRQIKSSIDVPSEVLRQIHRNNLEIAGHTLDEVAVENRDFSVMTMAIDPARLPEAKKRIQKFRRDLCKYLEGGEQTEVFRLSVQLFPLTEVRPAQIKTDSIAEIVRPVATDSKFNSKKSQGEPSA